VIQLLLAAGCAPWIGLNSGGDLGSRSEATGAEANAEIPSMHRLA
jgi:hypothetical protein